MQSSHKAILSTILWRITKAILTIIANSLLTIVEAKAALKEHQRDLRDNGRA